MTRVQAIKKFFEAAGPGSIQGRKVENREIMLLTKEERQEIGDACLAALGEEYSEK